MLTKVSATTAFLTAVLNAVVALGWWNITGEQVAVVTLVVVAAGTLAHVWFNPSIPFGVKA